MTRPPVVAYVGRGRWAEATVDVLLAGAGLLLVAVAAPELDGTRPIGLWLLVAYTLVAVVATLALAVAVAVTRQLPALTDGTLDGRPAQVVRAWGPHWWHAVALDAGLAVLGLALAVTGIDAGGDWAVLGPLPGLVGAWFAGRVVLVALGRRRRAALWLTATHVVVDSHLGRASAPRTAVRSVRGAGRRLVISLDRDAAWALPPRPWRASRVRRDTLLLDCADTAHRASDVAHWLSAELAARSFGAA